jgi:ABC-2 type transport system permease protein
LKTLFTAFYKRNLAFFKLAVVSNLEYRANFFMDAIMQPTITAGIEVVLWFAIFSGTQTTQIAGFGQEYYLAYAFWAAFISRITSNWMYEHRMINEVESGNLNTILTRPVTFFEYYLSQFMGYKVVTTLTSFIVPVVVLSAFNLPLHLDRLPIVLVLVFYYLIFVHLLSFIVSCLAFWFTRVSGLSVAKNLALWLFSGELMPLDLIPEPARSFILKLPFANAVYIPVGYLTGRIDQQMLVQGFVSTTAGIAVMGGLAYVLWKQGLKQYSGTGA